MALIFCPECMKEVSESADTCPHCGYKIRVAVKQKQNQERVDQVKRKAKSIKKRYYLLFAVFIAGLIAGGIYLKGMNDINELLLGYKGKYIASDVTRCPVDINCDKIILTFDSSNITIAGWSSNDKIFTQTKRYEIISPKCIRIWGLTDDSEYEDVSIIFSPKSTPKYYDFYAVPEIFGGWHFEFSY